MRVAQTSADNGSRTPALTPKRTPVPEAERSGSAGASVTHHISRITHHASRIRGEWFYIALVLVFALIIISPLLQPGYFWGAHDARHDAYFIFQYDKSVQDGIWLPRWSPDFTFGYGYPFFIVYGPLSAFIGELFHHFLGLGYEASVKAVLALSIVVSGLAMYGFVRSWLGRAAGLVAAVAYMVIPYHLVDVYVRAAMAESMALALLPLALWGFRETVRRPRLAAILGAGIAYALIMWTSNLVAIVFTPGLALYVVVLVFWQARRQSMVGEQGSTEAEQSAPAPPLPRSPARALVAPALAFALGLGLSAAFFVPAVMEGSVLKYINQTQWFGEYYDPTQHFVYFFQLFNPSWGFGISQPGPDDAAQGAMSFQLGAAATLLSLVALVTARRLRPSVRREVWFWALWALVSIFLTLGVSAWAWRHLPIVPYAQFPWRYLMLAILPLSILPATLVANGESGASSPIHNSQFEIRNLAWPAFLLAALLLLSSAPYLRVEMREPTVEQGPVSYAALMRFQRTSDEMTGVTAWVDPQQRPHWSNMADLWVKGEDVTTRVEYGKGAGQVPQTETLAVNSEAMGSAHEQVYFYAVGPGQSIRFNRFWYPGWTASLLDGKNGRPVRELSVEREDGPLARVVVPVPAGEGYILLRFEDTPLRAAAKWVTLGTMGLVAVVVLLRILKGRRARRDEKRA
jgi:hypothetical protein